MSKGRTCYNHAHERMRILGEIPLRKLDGDKQPSPPLQPRHDTGTGLDAASVAATADFAMDGIAASENLATQFKPLSQGVWELKLSKPVATLPKGTLTVSVKDRWGNTTQVERVFAVAKSCLVWSARPASGRRAAAR